MLIAHGFFYYLYKYIYKISIFSCQKPNLSFFVNRSSFKVTLYIRVRTCPTAISESEFLKEFFFQKTEIK